MNLNADESAESSLVKIYMDITGATESRARSVFIYLCGQDKSDTPGNGESKSTAPIPAREWIRPQPIPRWNDAATLPAPAISGA